ncbi:MAG: FAD-dependent oxidoreductase [Thermoleophilaceae bacterium]
MKHEDPATAGGLEETPDLYGAFPRLSDAQIRTLSQQGERAHAEPRDVLFSEGDEYRDFFVVLEGKVATYADYGTEEETLIALHGPGRFLGELGLLTGQAAFLTAVVAEPSELLHVPVYALRQLVARDPALGDVILRAYLARRSILIEVGAGLRIVGSCFSPDTRRLREFAARNRLPHRWIDLEEDQEAEQLLNALGLSPEETPVVIWRGQVLRNPSNAELARVIGLPSKRSHSADCDLLVVGAGPAGLAASVYGASEGLSTMTFDAVATGGQAGTSPRIENYLGFPSGLSGSELAERATLQAEKFGAQLNVAAEAVGLEYRDGHHVVTLDDGSSVSGHAMVIASGARYRKLEVERLEEFEGHSVHYAATLVEVHTCIGDPVVVVGGGNSAGQASLFLARHASQVHLLIAHRDLERDMSRYLADQIERDPQIEVMRCTEVRELTGEHGMLRAVVAENTETGERRTLPARALFVFIGAHPHTQWLGDQIALDDHGFILTGPAAANASNGGWIAGREALPLETSRPGVFAAGDVRAGSIKRLASAVGEGSMAVRLVHEHLEKSAHWQIHPPVSA